MLPTDIAMNPYHHAPLLNYRRGRATAVVRFCCASFFWCGAQSILPACAGPAYIGDSMSSIAGISRSCGGPNISAAASTYFSIAGLHTHAATGMWALSDASAHVVRIYLSNGDQYMVGSCGVGDPPCDSDCNASRVDPLATALLNAPRDALRTTAPRSVSATGDAVYILEGLSHRIRALQVDADGYPWPGAPLITVVGVKSTPGYTVDGFRGNATLISSPYGLSIGDAQRGIVIFWSEVTNHIIRALTVNDTVVTIAGVPRAAGFSGDGGPATLANINAPRGLDYDASTRILYFCDYANHVLRAVSAAGVISTIAGVAGSAGYNGDGVALTRTLYYPIGVTLVSQLLYVADFTNALVRVVNLTSGVITTLAGTAGNGTAMSTTTATPASSSTFAPIAVAVHPYLGVVFGDSSTGVVKRIQVSSNASTIVTIAGVPYIAPYSPDGLPATAANIAFPRGVKFNDSSGDLFFAETSSHIIRVVSASTGLLRTYAGMAQQAGYTGEGGPPTAARLSSPWAVCWGPNDTFIADTSNYVIRAVSSVSGTIRLFAGTPGVNTYAGDGLPATSASMRLPRDCLHHPTTGSLLIVDGYFVVRAVTASGTMTTFAGTGVNGYGGDGGPATSALIATPGMVVMLPGTGDVLLSDGSSCTIRVVSMNGTINTWLGTPSACGFSTNSMPRSAALLNAPRGMVFDETGSTLFFVDAGSHTVRALTNGNVSLIAGNGASGVRSVAAPPTAAQMWNPYHIAWSAARRVLVASSAPAGVIHAIACISVSPSPSSTASATLSRSASPTSTSSSSITSSSTPSITASSSKPSTMTGSASSTSSQTSTTTGSASSTASSSKPSTMTGSASSTSSSSCTATRTTSASASSSSTSTVSASRTPSLTPTPSPTPASGVTVVQALPRVLRSADMPQVAHLRLWQPCSACTATCSDSEAGPYGPLAWSVSGVDTTDGRNITITTTVMDVASLMYQGVRVSSAAVACARGGAVEVVLSCTIAHGRGVVVATVSFPVTAVCARWPRIISMWTWPYAARSRPTTVRTPVSLAGDVVTRRSWYAGARATLNATSVMQTAPALPQYAAIAAAVAALEASAALTSNSDGDVTLFMSTSTRLVLVSMPLTTGTGNSSDAMGSFVADMRVEVGPASASVLFVTSDGRIAIVATPNISMVCGTEDASCGYSALQITYPATLTPLAYGSTISCPPFCPGAFSDTVALMTSPNGVAAAAAVPANVISVEGHFSVPLPLLTSDTATAAALGLYYSSTCSNTGYTDPSDGSCLNASSPGFAGCAFGAGDACTLCPPGAVCPGGFRAWPMAGYYTPTESSGTLLPCSPPASARCLGWNAQANAVMCGSSFRARSVGCVDCAPGFFLSSDLTCTVCPPSSNATDLLRPVGIFLAAVAALVVVAYLICVTAAYAIGGTVSGGVSRMLQFTTWSFMTLQLVSQLARCAAPNAPFPLSQVYAALLTLQFQGVYVDAACMPDSYPFISDVALYALACCAWLSAIVACALYALARGRTQAKLAKAAFEGMWPLLEAAAYRACVVLLTLASVLYVPVVSSIVILLDCSTISLSAPAHAALDGAHANAVHADSRALVTATVMTRKPSFVCYAGSHAPAATLAWACVAVYIVAFPLGCAACVYAYTKSQRQLGAKRDAAASPDDDTLTRARVDTSVLARTVVPLLTTLPFRAKWWPLRHAVQLVSCILAGAMALQSRASSPVYAIAQAVVTCAAVLALAVVVVVTHPYAADRAWQRHVHIATLITAAAVAICTCIYVTGAVSVGTPASTALASVITAAVCVLTSTLLLTFIRSTVTSAAKEEVTIQEQLVAERRASVTSPRMSVVGVATVNPLLIRAVPQPRRLSVARRPSATDAPNLHASDRVMRAVDAKAARRFSAVRIAPPRARKAAAPQALKTLRSPTARRRSSAPKMAF